MEGNGLRASKRIDHYCDVPMAIKKGFLPDCDHDCKSCMACITIASDGKREHVNYSRKTVVEVEEKKNEQAK